MTIRYSLFVIRFSIVYANFFAQLVSYRHQLSMFRLKHSINGILDGLNYRGGFSRAKAIIILGFTST